MTRQYIGARYVPKFFDFDGSTEWKPGLAYEPLTIVTRNSNNYTSKIPVPSNIGVPEDNPTYWAVTGIYNEQLNQYRQEVEQLADDVDDYRVDVETYKNSIYNFIDTKARMVAEYQTSLQFNGATYVGNNKVVYYCCDVTNTGKLTCFNIVTKSLIWEYDMPLMHGNSIAYNPNNNKIYVTACFDQGDIGNVLDTVFIINLDNPNVIEETVHLSHKATAIAYDNDNDEFYALEDIGTVEGVCNIVNVYDSNLIYKKSITLKDYPSVIYKTSNQGIQCIYDGKIVIPFYEKRPALMMWDFEGNFVCSYTLPEFVSGYKQICEVQNCFVYDNHMYFGFVSEISLHNQGINFAITNIIDDIYEEEMITQFSKSLTITVNNKTKQNFAPALELGYLCDICDAFAMSKYHRDHNLFFNISGESVTKTLTIRNARGTYIGSNFSIGAINCVTCDMKFDHITFNHYFTVSGNNTLVSGTNSKLQFEVCTFDNGLTVYACTAFDLSYIYMNSCVYTNNNMLCLVSSGSNFYDADHKANETPTAGSHPGRIIELFSGTVTEGQTYNYNSNIIRGNIGTGYIVCVAGGGGYMGTYNAVGGIATGSIDFAENNNLYTRQVAVTIGFSSFTVNKVCQWNHSTNTLSTGGTETIKIYAVI